MPRRLCTWTDAAWRSADRSEHVVDGEASHTDICNLHSESKVYAEIAGILKQVVEIGPGRIADIAGKRQFSLVSKVRLLTTA